MPTICGLNLSISSLQGLVTSKVTAFLGISGTLGTLPGLTAMQAIFATNLASVKASLIGMLPEIPLSLPSLDGFSSLRDDLQSVVNAAQGGLTDLAGEVSGLTDMLSKYGGLTSLSGYADINLRDLAQSAIGLAGNFDPCSAVSNIPNVTAAADGALDSFAQFAPSLGKTIAAGKNILADQSFTDAISEATGELTALTSSLDISTLKSAITDNIQMAKTFSDGIVQKLPSGEEILLTKEALVASIQAEAANMIDEDTQSYFEGLENTMENLASTISTEISSLTS